MKFIKEREENIMRYLVVIILEDAITPIHNYYNDIKEAMKDVKKMKGVVDVTVYQYDPFNSKVLLKKAGNQNGNM